jgi:uncharacterized protein (DUF1501 family)
VSDLALGNPLFDVNCLFPTQDWLSTPVEGVLGQQFTNERAEFTRAARRAAQILLGPSGPKVAMLELPGFDTHVLQPRRLTRVLQILAEGLVLFAEAVDAAWRQTVVLVVTEFGRSVVANASGGTDHGMASVTFLMGGAVAGGRIGQGWPGLAPDQTDLVAKTDLRSIIKAVLTEHLRLPEHTVASIFPEAAKVKPMQGLFRG